MLPLSEPEKQKEKEKKNRIRTTGLIEKHVRGKVMNFVRAVFPFFR